MAAQLIIIYIGLPYGARKKISILFLPIVRVPRHIAVLYFVTRLVDNYRPYGAAEIEVRSTESKA
jgi:hypothetical protein